MRRYTSHRKTDIDGEGLEQHIRKIPSETVTDEMLNQDGVQVKHNRTAADAPRRDSERKTADRHTDSSNCGMDRHTRWD